jgi:hypothetical protein
MPGVLKENGVSNNPPVTSSPLTQTVCVCVLEIERERERERERT